MYNFRFVYKFCNFFHKIFQNIIPIFLLCLGLFALYRNTNSGLYRIHFSDNTQIPLYNFHSTPDLSDNVLTYIVGNFSGSTHDREFGITTNASILFRNTKYCQWHEETKSNCTQLSRDSQICTTNYRYYLDWSVKLVDSSKFLDSENHENNGKHIITPRRFYSKNTMINNEIYIDSEILTKPTPQTNSLVSIDISQKFNNITIPYQQDSKKICKLVSKYEIFCHTPQSRHTLDSQIPLNYNCNPKTVGSTSISYSAIKGEKMILFGTRYGSCILSNPDGLYGAINRNINLDILLQRSIENYEKLLCIFNGIILTTIGIVVIYLKLKLF